MSSRRGASRRGGGGDGCELDTWFIDGGTRLRMKFYAPPRTTERDVQVHVGHNGRVVLGLRGSAPVVSGVLYGEMGDSGGDYQLQLHHDGGDGGDVLVELMVMVAPGGSWPCLLRGDYDDDDDSAAAATAAATTAMVVVTRDVTSNTSSLELDVRVRDVLTTATTTTTDNNKGMVKAHFAECSRYRRAVEGDDDADSVAPLGVVPVDAIRPITASEALSILPHVEKIPFAAGFAAIVVVDDVDMITDAAALTAALTATTPSWLSLRGHHLNSSITTTTTTSNSRGAGGGVSTRGGKSSESTATTNIFSITAHTQVTRTFALSDVVPHVVLLNSDRGSGSGSSSYSSSAVVIVPLTEAEAVERVAATATTITTKRTLRRQRSRRDDVVEVLPPLSSSRASSVGEQLLVVASAWRRSFEQVVDREEWCEGWYAGKTPPPPLQSRLQRQMSRHTDDTLRRPRRQAAAAASNTTTTPTTTTTSNSGGAIDDGGDGSGGGSGCNGSGNSGGSVETDVADRFPPIEVAEAIETLPQTSAPTTAVETAATTTISASTSSTTEAYVDARAAAAKAALPLPPPKPSTAEQVPVNSVTAAERLRSDTAALGLDFGDLYSGDAFVSPSVTAATEAAAAAERVATAARADVRAAVLQLLEAECGDDVALVRAARDAVDEYARERQLLPL